ncbi:MAG: beta-galactosidase [Aristaeellaceae bacterium]
MKEPINKVLYGGDYNPEQWPEETWSEDMRLLKRAHIDVLTLNVFSWAALQPDETHYDFARLDRIMDMVHQNGFKVCLATSTAAHPAWMAKKHPDILRCGPDGIRRKFGGRHNSCPNSPTYRRYSVELARRLAQRYGHMENIVAWHIANEYGGECYCENCERAFRVWLRRRYGSLDALNRAWNTAFWGHTFYDWDEVVLPDLRSEEFDTGWRRTNFQGISLDYRRFNSDSMLECFCMERDAVKEITPDIPVTTNLMGFYQALDYGKWAKEMDFVSWDSYPEFGEPIEKNAMCHDLMRGIGKGKPFWLMEQTPSVSNWHDYCVLKRPGVMRLLSYQAIAHGADTVMFFQMRRSVGACEKYHGAVIDHAGRGDTRVFREVEALGAELERLGDTLLGAHTPAATAIVFDWDNWWASSLSAGPSKDMSVVAECLRWYKALSALNIPVDIIGEDDDLTPYRLVIAPMLYMVKGSCDDRLRSFVRHGGTLVATTFSGYVQENDLVVPGGYPGKLRDILGIWVEEIDALPPNKENSFVFDGQTYPARILCDLLHCEGAQPLAVYDSDFYAGLPAVTRHAFGEGTAYYVATCSGDSFYTAFLRQAACQAGVSSSMHTPSGLSALLRENENGRFLFLLNTSEEEKTARLNDACTELLSGCTYRSGDTVTLPAKDVRIMKICRAAEDEYAPKDTLERRNAAVPD